MTARACMVWLGAFASVMVLAMTTAADEQQTDESAPRFARIFSDNMVLQQEKPVCLWGWAVPGTEVSVMLTETMAEVVSLCGEKALARAAGKSGARAGDSEYGVRVKYEEVHAAPFETIRLTTRADKEGMWSLEIGPLRASFTPKFLAFASGGRGVALRDVLVGEVWVCAGQSNMKWAGDRSGWIDKEGLLEPAVRYALISPNDSWYRPKPELDDAVAWRECTEDMLKAQDSSTIPYLFGKFLHRRLKVPVGIVNTSKGGSYAMEWVSREMMGAIDDPDVRAMVQNTWEQADKWATDAGRQKVQAEYENAYAAELKHWEQAVRKAEAAGETLPAKPPQRSPRDPRTGRLCGLFNARVMPIARLTCKGVLFMQGETGGDAPRYPYVFPAVIASFRAGFDDPELPFGIVTLQGEGPTEQGPELDALHGYAIARDVHYRTHLCTPNTGFICAHDVGGGLHPDWKRPVAERAVFWAARDVYHDEALAGGSLSAHVAFEGDKALVTLEREQRVAVTKDGKKEWTLQKQPVLTPWPMTYNLHEYRGFAIAGADRRWYPGRVRPNLETKCLEISNPLVAEPVALRYGWSGYSMANIGSYYDPLPPFRTDDWPTTATNELPYPQSRVAEFKNRNDAIQQKLDRTIKEGAVDAERAEFELYAEPRSMMLSRVRRVRTMLDTLKPETLAERTADLSKDLLAEVPERYAKPETIWAKWAPYWNAGHRLASLPEAMDKVLKRPEVAVELDNLRRALADFEAAVEGMPDPEPLPEAIRPNPPAEWR